MVEHEFPEEAVNLFLRTVRVEFSLKTLQTVLKKQGFETAVLTLLYHLQAHPLVFSKGNDIFISRAGVFTDRFFSIKPTKEEVTLGILIPGHRSMPFSDPEIYPHELTFMSNEIVLAQKVSEISLNTVLSVYNLYGEEYIPQYIAIDPASEDSNFIDMDYELPHDISLTVWDMQDLYALWDFKYGDRMLARVVNWDVGTIELMEKKEVRSTPFEFTISDELKSHFFLNMEQSLEHMIEVHGPRSSIEEQIAYTFFDFIDILCTSDCCSLEEYLRHSHKINIEYYGVESRIWKKGEEIPALDIWNKDEIADDDLSDSVFAEIDMPIPSYMIDAYVLDSLYRNETKYEDMLDRITPDLCFLNEAQLKIFLLQLDISYAALAKTYNRFLDFQKGKVRFKSLQLYSSLLQLTYNLDSCGIDVSLFPQQPLVILSQLFSHTGRFIETFLHDGHLSEHDFSMATASLDGMSESFDDIAEELIYTMKNGNKDDFTIV